MRLLKAYAAAEPRDWTPATIETEARNHVVIDRDGRPWAVFVVGNRWTVHAAAGTENISGLDLWTALDFLNSRACRLLQ